jgi:ABC-type branched-subunit amino acid transport system substrate-binding protein
MRSSTRPSRRYHSISCFLCIQLSIFFATSDAQTQTIKIGGLFPSLKSIESREQEAGLLLALSHLNDKSDGLYDNLLPNHTFQTAVVTRESNSTTLLALSQIFHSKFSDNTLGVDVLISTEDTLTAPLVSMINRAVLTGQSETSMGGINLSPSYAMEGKYLQKYLCEELSIREFSLITSADDHGLSTALLDGSSCSFAVLSQLVVTPSANLTSILPDKLHAMDALFTRVYVILIEDPSLLAQVLEVAHEHFLLKTSRHLFLSSRALSSLQPSHFTSAMTTEDIAQALRGTIGLRVSSRPSSVSPAFYSAWLAQSSTWCSPATDDTTPSHPLHRLEVAGGSSTCSGLNFSSYALSPLNSSLSLSALYVYDSTVMVARALHSLLVDKGQASFTKTELLRAIQGLHTTGASGAISFDERGNRDTGFRYEVLVFDSERYATSSVTLSYGLVGVLNDTHYLPCSLLSTEQRRCIARPVFNSLDNSPPTDARPYSHSSMPAVLKIGAFFQPYDSEGAFFPEQAQYMAAFLMAIEEINDKTDGLWDNLLPNTTLVSSIQIPDTTHLVSVEDQAVYLSDNAFTTGVTIALSALDSDLVKSTHRVLTQTKLPMIHSVATAAEFGEGSVFPYKVQTSPVSSFQGMVFQNILCHHFRYQRVAIFSGIDELGVKSAMELQDGSYCPLEVLSYHKFPDGLLVEEMLQEALAAGANIFLFFFSASQVSSVAEILEKGHDMKLFDDSKQLFGNEEISSPALVSAMSSPSKAEMVLKGYLSLQYAPLKMFLASDLSAPFIERWRQRSPTSGTWSASKQRVQCDLWRGDEAETDLFQSSDLADQGRCGGLNFSAFRPDGQDFAPFVGHTYDATIALAMALDRVVRDGQISSPHLGDLLMEAFTTTVQFQGITREVEFSPGMSQFANYARGNREVGHIYTLRNFQPVVTTPVSSAQADGGFVEVGVWSLETELVMTAPVVYRTVSNTPPQDRDPDHIVALSASVRILLAVVGFLSVLVTLLFALLIFLARTHKFMIASQLKLMALILFGGLLSSLRVLNAYFPITDATCTTGLWLGHMGFLFAFLTLTIKTYRLYRLLGTMKRMKFTQNQAVTVILLSCTAAALYLTFLTSYGEPHQSARSSLSHNLVTREQKCDLVHPEFHTALFAFEALLLVTGFFLAYKTKDAPDSVNEAQYIAGAVTLITVVCSLIFPLVFLLSSITPQTKQMIASLTIGLVTIAVMLIVFLPKVLLVYLSPTGSTSAASNQWQSTNHSSNESNGDQGALHPSQWNYQIKVHPSASAEVNI